MEFEPGHLSLELLFHEAISDAVLKISTQGDLSSISDYLTKMLLQFVRTEQIFQIKDRNGVALTSIYEMLAEADVLLNADSFEREREVHFGQDLVCNYSQQGRTSYKVVSTFDYKPFDQEAPLFLTLSEGFDDFSQVLGQVRKIFPFLAA